MTRLVIGTLTGEKTQRENLCWRRGFRSESQIRNGIFLSRKLSEISLKKSSQVVSIFALFSGAHRRDFQGITVTCVDVEDVVNRLKPCVGFRWCGI